MSNHKIYGVKNDEIVTKKLMEILDTFHVGYDFYDFKDFPPTDAQFKKWGEFEGMELPINERSTFFKNEKRHFIKLDEKGKMDWLRKNNHIIIRPIIEDANNEILMMGGRPERIAKVIFGLDLKC